MFPCNSRHQNKLCPTHIHVARSSGHSSPHNTEVAYSNRQQHAMLSAQHLLKRKNANENKARIISERLGSNGCEAGAQNV